MLAFILSVFIGISYYVSPTGNDGSNGSINAPWKNLSHAITQTAPGDTIFMRNGIHNMDEVHIRRDRGHGGKEGMYLTIKNFPNEKPFLKYSSRRLILAADFVRVEGLDVEMPWRFDVFGAGNQIINNRLTGPQPKFGAIETGGINILIEGNYIEYDDIGGNTMDHGIYVHAGRNITILDNTVIRAKGYGIHVFDQNPGASFDNYIIQGNFIRDCQTRAGIILATQGNVTMNNMTIQRNISVNNAWYGLYLREGNNIKVFNNTFDGNFLTPLNVANVTNIEVKNNIFSKVSQGLDKVIVFEMNDINTNLFFNVEPFGENPVTGDPLLNDDYSLRKGSPAIDAGIKVGLPFNNRFPDLGAIESDFVTGINDTWVFDFTLEQNYPNPFNPVTTIRYTVDKIQMINIKIYNILGQEVSSLVNKEQIPGFYSVNWDGSMMPSGIYIYSINGYRKKMTLLK